MTLYEDGSLEFMTLFGRTHVYRCSDIRSIQHLPTRGGQYQVKLPEGVTFTLTTYYEDHLCMYRLLNNAVEGEGPGGLTAE